MLRDYTPLAAPDQPCLAKVFQSSSRCTQALSPLGRAGGRGWGGGGGPADVPGGFGAICKGMHLLSRAPEETVLGDLSQMQSLLIFPGVFSLVLALGAVHQASILEEANNSDSYSLSLVWALHGARLRFRG